MANKKTICQAKRIISIAEEQSNSNLYMVIDFVLLDTLVNINNIQYSENFILDISDNSETYAGIPLKVDYKKLIAKKTDKLTHNLDPKTKKLSNQMIGSFFKFYHQNNDEGILELCGQVRIPKEFEEACEVIQQLYDDENLNVSYEIIVGESTKTGKITNVDVSDENYLFAYSIVSNPAVTSAKAFALVGELIESNQTIEGGEQTNMERNKETFTAEIMFANTKMNLAEINIEQVRKKIYAQLKTILGDDYWYYDAVDMGVDYIVLQIYSTGDLMKVDYSVVDNEVVVSESYPVDKTYISKSKKEEELEMATVKELETKVTELETQIASLNTSATQKDTLIAEKETALATKETELAEVNTKVEVLSASVLEKDNKIKELEPIQTSYNTLMAEKATVEAEVKKTALKEKFSKLLSAEILAEVEIAEAIQNLDESKLNSKVVEIAMASATKVDPKTKETLVASRITDNVSIGKNTLVSKYITINE